MSSSTANDPSGQLPFRPFTGVMPFRPAEPAADPPQKESLDAAELSPRYRLREDETGPLLRGKDAPGVRVRIDRSYAFSEAEARKLGERTILLDGAGQFGPLVDDTRHLYNLDHHLDCSRAFTLATCEQALILVLKGLDLDTGEWTIYANDPDLDTICAIWILLNHRRLKELDDRARDVVLPLIRLEGSIDANGLEIGRYSGLTRASYDAAKERLDVLFEREQELKKNGLWHLEHLYEHTLRGLHQIDCWVYDRCDFDDVETVEHEHAVIDIGQNRVALVVGDSAGIYEVEERLKQEWGERLGIVALARDARNYTLRKSAALAGYDLTRIYDHLNLLDPVVDGRPPEKRWGGSEDIGGSPRPEGTMLHPIEIAKILQISCAAPNPSRFARKIANAVGWSSLLALLVFSAVQGWRAWTPPDFAPALQGAAELLLGAGLCAVAAVFLIRRTSRGWMWAYGWRRPAGDDWIVLLPPAILGAALGGLPTASLDLAASPPAGFGALAVAAVAWGLWATSFVHGSFLLEAPVQTVAGRWFVSRAAWSTGAFCAIAAVASRSLWTTPSLLSSPWDLLLTATAGVLCGVSLAMIRERSLSVLPAIIGAFLGLAAQVVLSGVLSL